MLTINIIDKLRNGIVKFLKIDSATPLSISVREQFNFEDNCFKNRLWYRGESNELNTFYHQVQNTNYSFWGSIPTAGLEIRKIHTGLPKLITNTLCNIVLSDFNGVDFETNKIEVADYWDKFQKDNGFEELIKRAFKQTLYLGDGAFKFSTDPELSDVPILEWYPADRVEYKYNRGRLKEIIFNTQITPENGSPFVLKEFYGIGYINYKLFRNGSEVNLNALRDTEGLQDVVFNGDFIMAVPMMFFKSEKYEGRGESIFEGKIDNFDSLDECWSQWIEALRSGRPTTYIPEMLLPRDPETGAFIKPNTFDNKFIKISNDLSENAQNKIDVEQVNIPHDSYLATYVTALDLCLQGLISPSTLGIDVKKLDNAEAQREKEKTTLYTRQALVESFRNTVENLVDVLFKIKSCIENTGFEEIKVTVNFGEYATPSFESLVETMSNPNTPMSIEAKVEELWGNSKDEDWKQEEIARIKEQSGVVTMDEPAVNVDYGNI